MLCSKSLSACASIAGAMRNAVAVALIGVSGVASAGYVTFDEGAIDTIFSQPSFYSTTLNRLLSIDIRFNERQSIVAPTLLDINNDAEFSGGTPSLSGLANTLGIPNFTLAMFFVYMSALCGDWTGNIIGCGSTPGGLIALDSSFAHGANGAALMAHELAHNLGLPHLVGDPNLMNPVISSTTTLTAQQVGEFVNLSTGASISPIVRKDNNGQLYISVTPIAVLAAVPEPQPWAMMIAGLLGVTGWARRRRACAG